MPATDVAGIFMDMKRILRNLRRIWKELLILLLTFSCLFLVREMAYRHTGWTPEVRRYRADLEKAAADCHIEGYLDYLLAIMEVESGGKGKDIMQSSESLGQKPNSLDTQASIGQACRYFAELLDYAGKKQLSLDSVLQAYNYGTGYLDYVAAHGGVHSETLAESYAREQSGGEKEPYHNTEAILKNGGWRYRYGNMFYADLVEAAYQNYHEGAHMHIISRILITLTALELFYMMFLETFQPRKKQLLAGFGIYLGEPRSKILTVLYKKQGIRHGILGIMLFYAAWFSSEAAERSGFLLLLAALSALYDCFLGGPLGGWKGFVKQGGLAAVSLISIFIL